MQCSYNVTLGRVCAAINALRKQRVLHKLSVCVCSLGNPVCNAHAPYYLWPAPLYNIPKYYLINDMISGNTFFNTKCVFHVSLHHLSEEFLILQELRKT